MATLGTAGSSSRESIGPGRPGGTQTSPVPSPQPDNWLTHGGLTTARSNPGSVTAVYPLGEANGHGRTRLARETARPGRYLSQVLEAGAGPVSQPSPGGLSVLDGTRFGWAEPDSGCARACAGPREAGAGVRRSPLSRGCQQGRVARLPILENVGAEDVQIRVEQQHGTRHPAMMLGVRPLPP